MKKLWLAGLATLALSGASAMAQDDDMAPTYANTVVVTDANGATTRYYFEPDHTWTGQIVGGVALRGRWERDGDQLCYLAPSGQKSCAPFETGKQVGDSWMQDNAQGQPVTMTLAAGRP